MTSAGWDSKSKITANYLKRHLRLSRRRNIRLCLVALESRKFYASRPGSGAGCMKRIHEARTKGIAAKAKEDLANNSDKADNDDRRVVPKYAAGRWIVSCGKLKLVE